MLLKLSTVLVKLLAVLSLPKLLVGVVLANVIVVFGNFHISNDWALPLNTVLLIVLALISRQQSKKLEVVRDTSEKTFQSTTHAANAAEGAARSAAISTIVASKHLGVDLRSEDLDKLTEALNAPAATADPPPAPPAPPTTSPATS